MKKRVVTNVSIISIILTSFIVLTSCTNNTIKDINIIKTKKVSVGSYKAHIIDKRTVIETLTSDKFEGRAVGSKGNRLTEDYLENLFKDIGLSSVFNNKYRHKYDTSNSNIIGKIDGKSDNAIIISAHFDHIGIQDGKIIRGAIDNASGVSVLLEVAETLKNKYSIDKPEFDIIFAAFNGEESGMKGSSEFVHDIIGEYDNLIDINIDSVGYKNGGKVTFLNNKGYDTLNKSMEKILKNNGLEVTLGNKILGRSDSDSFKRPEMKSICIIEENVKEVIHSERDTPEMVDYSRLDKISNSVIELVESITYD
ncbi:M28 family peptidase [Clostridium bornimense]|uniref:M28 family metallopeptidase n=1 Tax=Clostridium bornimense TaxID=1216932 RepID=UPI001C120061|nr:M28 family peptidase [Clostridium bornimense]MBU5317856.1 M28 family peptidase [Clostridium bornimense]